MKTTYKLLLKGYSLNLVKIQESYFYDDLYTQQETINEAKYDLLKKLRYEYCTLSNSNQELEYKTIPVIRNKKYDLYEFEDKKLTSWEINYIIKKRERNQYLDLLLESNPESFCYIKKGGYYYRPNSCGYSEYKRNAGVYTLKQGVQEAKSCQELDVILIDIKEHNEYLEREIVDLKSRLL